MCVSSTANLTFSELEKRFLSHSPINKGGVGIARLLGVNRLVAESNWAIQGELDKKGYLQSSGQGVGTLMNGVVPGGGTGGGRSYYYVRM